MTIRNLFITVSALIVLIMAVAIALIAWETRDVIKTDVLDQRNELKGNVLRILAVTDDLMAKRVESSLSLLTARGFDKLIDRLQTTIMDTKGSNHRQTT